MVGIDIIEVERVEYSDGFMSKIANPSEIDYINKSPCQSLRHQRLASLFCIKEAVLKALGTGASEGIGFKDIELNHEPSGKPFVELHRKALEKFNLLFQDKKIEVSISHTEKYATAIAVIL